MVVVYDDLTNQNGAIRNNSRADGGDVIVSRRQKYTCALCSSFNDVRVHDSRKLDLDS